MQRNTWYNSRPPTNETAGQPGHLEERSQGQRYLDIDEKFGRCKAIDKVDEVEVVPRLLSKYFMLSDDYKLNEKAYPTDALQVP